MLVSKNWRCAANDTVHLLNLDINASEDSKDSHKESMNKNEFKKVA